MKKLAYGNGLVYVGLTGAEFRGLAGRSYNDVPDGEDISLAPIKAKIDLVDSKEAELLELKTIASSVVDKLNQIGI